VALNEALIICGFPPISEEDHLATYNGLPTRTKLSLLGITEKTSIDTIAAEKQKATMALLKKFCKTDIRLLVVLQQFKDRGYRLAVASNSIRLSVDAMIKYIGASAFFEFTLSNEDVASPKPHPEMYSLACQKLGLNPWEVLVVEDSPHGQRACLEAGCRLCVVDNPEDVTLERLLGAIKEHEALGYLVPAPKPKNKSIQV
jgi:HAD superfamily hydrolase (TIGR01509 family)